MAAHDRRVLNATRVQFISDRSCRVPRSDGESVTFQSAAKRKKLVTSYPVWLTGCRREICDSVGFPHFVVGDERTNEETTEYVTRDPCVVGGDTMPQTISPPQ